MLPVWVVVVIFGRELFITLFRAYAASRGVVIPAGTAGSTRPFWQNFAVGSGILWYALHSMAHAHGWSGSVWAGWQRFHFGFSVVTLSAALVLTVYSMLVYLWNYRTLSTPGRP